MVDITVVADLISKKNAYRRKANGGMFKPANVVSAEQDVMAQIPVEYHGLALRHPAVEFKAWLPSKNKSLDRDGVYTTLLDILVKLKIIKDDNVRNFNGPVYIHPCGDSSQKVFSIRLYEDGVLRISKYDDVI